MGRLSTIGYFEGISFDAETARYGRKNAPIATCEARVESAGEIDRRLSATRVIATGGLGLFWKKKVDSREVYLTIDGPDAGWMLELKPKKQAKARRFATEFNAAAKKAALAAPPPAVEAPVEPAQQDPLEALAKLGALRDSGVLTDAEFEAQKAVILNAQAAAEAAPPA